jgi:Holliday junction DNA helicase RuvA
LEGTRLIRRIRGQLADILVESILVDVGGICYEVFLPPHVHEVFEGRAPGSEVELCTFHYLTSEPTKSVPVLLGFENELQRDFFELLTDVPRMGPRGALRAMAIPVGTLARAIELQDTRVLKSLPGVGAQRAKDMIATLAGKLGRFVDVRELEHEDAAARPLTDFEADALEVLMQLGMSRGDAEQALRAVREAEPDLTAPDILIRRVFQNR